MVKKALAEFSFAPSKSFVQQVSLKYKHDICYSGLKSSIDIKVKCWFIYQLNYDHGGGGGGGGGRGLPSQHSMVGHYRHASETPFQWRFAGGPMMAHF